MDHAKFWLRLRRLTTDISVIGLLASCLLGAPVAAQQAAQQAAPSGDDDAIGAVESAEAVPAVLQHFLESVDSFRARFVQELWSDDLRLIDVAEGDVELLRPGRFRWHYEEPWEQIIVADGETLWMYDVDLSQVTRSALAANDAGNPGALLSGDTEVLDSFEIVGDGSEEDEVWVRLTPRIEQSDYASVRVAFTLEDAGSVLSELEFVDGLNQTTVIRFLDAEVNPQLGLEVFEFEIPENAHVLGGPG